jgi:flavin-dependent dehydrogenase
MLDNDLFLKNGSKIAIIGGGPAGTFFAHFASRYATEIGIDVSIKIFDRKNFCVAGPGGCNMCAGVISENLYNKLEEEEIHIAQYCVQRKIEAYSFVTPDDCVSLHHPVPGHTPNIVTVFRGNGPLSSSYEDNVSFDGFLLNHVQNQGAKVIPEIIKELKLSQEKGGPVKVIYGQGASRKECEVDLVVGAFGVNTGMMERIGKMGFGYKPPKTVRTCQCEIMLSNDHIERIFGNRVFVFALGNKDIKFASITPKVGYVTVNLVGKTDLTRNNLIAFLNHQAVRKLMPKDWEIPKSFCTCISKIPITYAKHPFGDRVVILGDASISRTYKSGIEAAFNMARLSAYTAFKHGISERAFMNGYFKPAKRLLARDNVYGTFMLKINDYISSKRWIANTQIKIIRSERDLKTAKQVNEILWNMLTGNVPYKEIFYKAINPRLISRILPATSVAWARQKWETINAWLRRKRHVDNA